MLRLAARRVGVASSEAWNGVAARGLSTSTDLRATFAAMIPGEQEKLKAIKKTHGAKVIDSVKVEQVMGGMRGTPGFLYETSLLDAEEGIRFRGYTIPDLQAKLPAAKPGGEPLPEGLFWLLLTGEIPTQAQVAALSAELKQRATIPSHVLKVLDELPDGTHSMTQLSIGLMAMQPQSKFAAAYKSGVHKTKYWESVYEDALDVIAKLPPLAAAIYRRSFKKAPLIAADPSLDWAGNYAHMMGYGDSEGAKELMRLYQTIHADHEGGNVSAHSTYLVGSALSDPYLSFAAGLNGLAGPLHGLANQEVLLWINQLRATLGDSPTKEQLREYVQATLKSGRVVPGYGHAVLRKTDPRYTCQKAFAEKHMPNDPGYKMVAALYDVVPEVLLATGKVKNPWPNVDAHSGVLLQHYGIAEAEYYTVMFGVSRSIGCLAQLVISRAMGYPIERPKSFTSEWIVKQFGAVPK